MRQCVWLLMNLCVREARFNREGLHEAVVRYLKGKLINILRQYWTRLFPARGLTSP
jgi:hypothetical protein